MVKPRVFWVEIGAGVINISKLNDFETLKTREYFDVIEKSAADKLADTLQIIIETDWPLEMVCETAKKALKQYRGEA